jgi:AraC-like DNA-binding protein
MLSASQILPHPSLAEFVRSFTLCAHSSANVNIGFPLYAHHETTIGFFLGDTSIQISNQTSKAVTKSKSNVFLFGLSTSCKEAMASNGDYRTFTIEFEPNGFFKMSGVPANEIADNNFSASEVMGNGINRLYHRLLHATNEKEMVALANRFIISTLKRRKKTYANDGITKISPFLLANSTMTTISQYACDANMSLRNFERRFIEQVGTSPKSYCRLLRFNAAFNFKLSNPGKCWADIADVFGYYDSMHLVKEFKQFTNFSPAMLLDDNPGFITNSCYKVYPTVPDLFLHQ